MLPNRTVNTHVAHDNEGRLATEQPMSVLILATLLAFTSTVSAQVAVRDLTRRVQGRLSQPAARCSPLIDQVGGNDEISMMDWAVVTVGALQAGSSPHIIPGDSLLRLNVRTSDEQVRETVLAAIMQAARCVGVGGPPQIEDVPKPSPRAGLTMPLDCSLSS
jgi:hypothetical protein